MSWFVVYGLIITDTLSSNFWLLVAGFTLLGFVNIFLAFNIMHDACQGAYSPKNQVSELSFLD